MIPGYPVPQSQWVKSSSSCAACRRAFMFITPKENCTNCGNLFCSACLKAKCSVSPQASATPVCDKCFQMINAEPGSSGKELIAMPAAENTPITSSITMGASVPRPVSMEEQLSKVKGEMQVLMTTSQQLRTENERLIDLLSVKDQMIAELIEGGNSENSPLKKAEELSLQLQRTIQTLEKGREVDQANEQALRQQVEASHRENVELSTRCQALQKVSEESQQKIQAVEVDLHRCIAERDVAANEVRTAETRNAELEKELARLQGELLSSQERCKSVEESGTAWTASEKVLKEEQASLKVEAASLREKLKVVEQQCVREKGRAEELLCKAEARHTEETVAVRKMMQRELQDMRERADRNAVKLEEEKTITSRLKHHLHVVAVDLKAQIRQLRDSGEQIAMMQSDTKREAVRMIKECGEALATIEESYEHLSRSAPVTSEKTNDSTKVVVRDDNSASCSHGQAEPSRWNRSTIVEATRRTAEPVGRSEANLLDGLERWSFDIKGAASTAPSGSILQAVAGAVATKWSLFPSAKVENQWRCLIATVELNYRPNPYHNAIHAADVLHGVYVLVNSCPGLLSHMTLIEKRAIAFAAAVHDVRHPGRTESFLRQTFDGTYLHYNGHQVLEQMHVATAFELLGARERDFTEEDMSDTDALLFHSLVSFVVGCTFMGCHNTCMERWNRQLSEHGGYDVSSAADRRELLAIFLHAADIGAQSKGVEVALKWLDVVEEMYQQGDEEAAKGLAQSPGCSRGGNLERGQIFFLEVFVAPLFDLIHRLFPSISEPLNNLCHLHAYYSEKLNEPQRAFPTFTQNPPCGNTSTAPLKEKEKEVQKSDADPATQQKNMEAMVRKLREAREVIAQRHLELAQREAEVAEQWRKIEASPSQKSTSAKMEESELNRAHAELLEATAAVVAREQEVEKKAKDLDRIVANVEEREQAVSALSVQLASIAEKMNTRRRLLRFRESCLRTHQSADADTTLTGMLADSIEENRFADQVLPRRACVKFSTPSLYGKTEAQKVLEGVLRSLSRALEDIDN